MLLLQRRLAASGYRPSRFDYMVALADLQTIADGFTRHVQEVLEQDGEEARRELATGDAVGESPARPSYAVVGHSLGNIITRLASPLLPVGFRRFIMLAPPNRPSVMARLLRDNPVFRLATRDAGQKISDDEFYARLPVPQVPSLIIAGTQGPRSSWLPFEGQPNDSVVRVEETRLDGVPTLEVPGIHTFLMNRSDVQAAIENFLDDPTGALRGAPERGDFCGEMSLFDEATRSQSVRALSAVRLVKIDRRLFQHMLRRNPEIAIRMIRKLAGRLSQAEERLLSSYCQVPPAEKLDPPSRGQLTHQGDGGAVFMLPESPTALVGRLDPVRGLLPEIDLTAIDPQVSTSRRHARILCQEGQFLIVAEQATNGTFVNGQRLEPNQAQPLQPGDQISFGAVQMLFSIDLVRAD